MKKLFFIYLLGMGCALSQNIFDPVPQASELLNSFYTDQKDQATFSFDAPAKIRWHYLPHSSFKREGLPLSQMTPDQIEKTYALLDAFLSDSGYDQMEQIIELENYLAAVENNPEKRDPTKYYLAFYGTPKQDATWAWSFEGHHLSLNFTVSPDEIAFAPAFWGSNPGVIPIGPDKGKVVLKSDHDRGLKLINALSEKQFKKTLISAKTYGEILTENHVSASFIKKNGINYSELNHSQQKLLKKIVYHHLERMEKLVAKRAEALLAAEDWNAITFSWAGATKKLKAHYYRIQGANFLIEYDNSQNNGNHIHAVWREFKGDFGKDLIRDHYGKEH